MKQPARVGVAVITYRRPENLGTLLPHLLEQSDRAASDLGLAAPPVVIVVDNDPEGSAAPVVEAADDARIRYVREPEPGLAAARNRAMDAADDCDALAFIDDDEIPLGRWLSTLVETAVAHAADVVAGPVVSVFDRPLDPWMEASGTYLRAHRAHLRTGDPITRAATNNLLLDLRTVRALGVRFDERFGQTGGEDSFFTGQLHRGGATMVWCAEAPVEDHVLVARLNREFSLRRRYGMSNADARVAMLLERGPRRLRARVACATRGVAQILLGVGEAVRGRATRTLRATAQGERHIASGLGFLGAAVGVVATPYRRKADPAAAPAPAPRPAASAPGTAVGAIVVVNYGSSALIRANLLPEAVAESGCLVVVVDNFSTAAERTAVAELCAERGWHLVPNDRNEGFGGGVNRGVERAIELGAGVFVALNPDAVASGAVLAELVATVNGDDRRIVAPWVLSSAGRPFFRGMQVLPETGRLRVGWSEGDADPTWRNWLSGACFAVSRRAFEVTGGMDEAYFMYWEDVDFSLRASAAGFELVLRDDLSVIHDEGGTQGARRDGKSALYYYYNTRNRLLFGARNAPASRWRYLVQTPRESWRVWSRGGRRQLVTNPGSVWAVFRGSLAGVATLARRVAPPPVGRPDPE